MNTFRNLHPVTLLCCFLYITVFSVFNFNPIYSGLSLCGAFLFALVIQDKKAVLRSFIGYFILLILIAVTNPLFSHNGTTALFFINDNRITLEAFIYGVTLGMAVVSVLYWFRCFNEVFDSEKYLYVFGRISPKLALVFSMTLRFVPELIGSFKSVNASQKCFDKSRGRLRRYLSSFSAVIGQSLEDAVITSDSMNARGFNLKKRTSFSRFRFTFYDAVYLTVFTVLTAVAAFNTASFEYYPTFCPPELDLRTVIGIISFGALAFIPFVYEISEEIRWKLSLSKI